MEPRKRGALVTPRRPGLPADLEPLAPGDEFHKRCVGCDGVYPVTFFRRDRRRPDGRRANCKYCVEDGRTPILGACPLCGKHSEDLILDHSHENAMYRDLICRGCNAGLGFFRDDPEALERAAAYVRQHRENPTGITYIEAQKRLRPKP